jgi:Cu(I)/Ag(I) efflux system membrane fusion protein
MNPKILIALAAAGLLGAGLAGGYWIASHRSMADTTPKTEGTTADTRKPLYYHDPMVPQQKFDKPGKSPFMDMQLVPVYADSSGDSGTVAISPRVQQNLGVRTAEVTKATVAQSIEAVGNVMYNEREVAVVQARSGGFIEKLLVRAPLDPVRKGQPLAELYVPDWVATQEEYLALKRIAGNRVDALVSGARERMRQAGMTEAQIQLVESTNKVQPRLTVTAPIGGVVGELTAREGMTVMTGASLFRINGLGSVWVNAEIPESQAGLVRPGNVVAARTPALPGVVFNGRVSAILPEVSTITRTLKARIELANPGGRLVPGMFATVSFTPAVAAETLVVPTEAVIQTGKRSVVVVAQDDGRFAPVDVEIGVESNGRTEIRKGVHAGQKVVISGQFLIDSEASLKATETRMSDAPNDMQSGNAKTDKVPGNSAPGVKP